jgi:cob(I)alamin adenosyltransferase
MSEEIKKAKVYTRSGDAGKTALVGGERISKSNNRIDLYGEVDELNSHVGFSRSLISKNEEQFEYLEELQVLLFDLGSNLACLPEDREKYKLPKISQKNVEDLESLIDKIEAQLEPLKYFILPGGNQLSSALHICRTVTRRIERKAILFNEDHTNDLPNEVFKFINRLSDYFFVLARLANKLEGNKEVFWIPRK